jgi:pilus assembly protein Flp/PilA
MYTGSGRGTRLRSEDHPGRKQMKNTLLNLYLKFQGLKNREEGQDLVEYALLVALIALVCVTGVSNVATAINTVFSNISASLS